MGQVFYLPTASPAAIDNKTRDVKVKRYLNALQAEERMQKILEKIDGGWYDFQTQGFDKNILKNEALKFRRIKGDQERIKYAQELVLKDSLSV